MDAGRDSSTRRDGGDHEDDAGDSGAELGATMRVGAMGAELSVASATVSIPEGALSVDVEVTLTEIPPAAEGDRLAPIFLLEPEGLQFDKPITIRITLSEEPVTPPLAYWTNGDALDILEPVVEGNVATVTNTHFSSLTVSYQRCGNGTREDGAFLCKHAVRDGIGYRCDNLVRLSYEECDDGNKLTDACAYGSTAPCEVCDAKCTLVQQPAVYCGDGTSNGTEQCDDGNTVLEVCPYGAACTVCNPTCQLVAGAQTGCGDGTTNGGEQCDDGNATTESCTHGQASCTVCSATCQLIAGATTACGDGQLNGTDLCDDGNTAHETCPYGTTCLTCGPVCTAVAGLEERCGDSTINGPEDCDDGNAVTEVCPYDQNCTTCTMTCSMGPGRLRHCGDGIVSGPESCDDGNALTDACAYGETSCSVCDSTCNPGAGIVTGYCGDGTMNGPEACDGTDLGGKSCQSIGYVSGALGCDGGCALDSAGCSDIATARPIVANGGGFCALQADSTIACWGQNAYRTLRAPPGTFIDVALGEQQGCGVRGDGTLACWGSGPAASNVPAGTDFKKVVVGNQHACALRTDSTAVCWGSNGLGQATAHAGMFTDLVAGAYSTCAIRSADGSPDCWGNVAAPNGLTSLKQVVVLGASPCFLLGDDTTTCGVAGTFQRLIGTNSLVTCGIRDDNSVECWNGGGGAEPAVPGTFVSYAYANSGLACGQTTSDGYQCSASGGSNTEQYGPRVDVDSVALPGTHQYGAGGCFVEQDDTLACWGGLNFIAAPGAWQSFDVGSYAGCGITASGAVGCLGLGAQVAEAPAGNDFTRVKVSEEGLGGCALRTDGSFTCFIMPGTSTFPTLPGTGSYVAVDLGSTASVCAIDDVGALHCWDKEVPSYPPPATGTFTALSMGLERSCAVNTSGGLVCWGDWGNGSTVPVEQTFVDVSVGRFHACALRVDGTVLCFGRDSFATGDHLAAPAGTFTSISAGYDQSCGRRPDGRLSCWGVMARTP